MSKDQAKELHRLIPDTAYRTYSEYASAQGEDVVTKARGLKSDEILKEVLDSGLRGRGGAGFLTGVKWSGLSHHSCKKRFVVCNGAEGEPGTFKDRFLLRKNPYATLEGMLIAAHVISADQLYIAMKGSFKKELSRVESAIEEMTSLGLFDQIKIKVIRGPEEYLFGEEKALLNVIEGGEPCPREAHYPPYEVGLFGNLVNPNPALVNNVETYARVSSIIRNGAKSFRTLVTEDTPGLLIFTVCGDVARPGVFEMEAGVTIKHLLNDIAGGAGAGRRLVAALSGVSSRVILAKDFDTTCEFGALKGIGSGLGSAGFIVFDDKTDMGRVTQAMARFLYVESCNQCAACKHGLRTASAGLDKMFSGSSSGARDLEQVLHGAKGAPQGNRCYLPIQGSRIIPSLIENFRTSFQKTKKCFLSTSPYQIPKIRDFDEEKHLFIYDEAQMVKRPDW